MPNNTAIIHPSDRPDVQSPTASAIMPVGGSLSTTSFRVLIVDDEPNIALVLQRILSALPDTSAVSTQNPLDALTYSQKYSFDVVITDYQMPEMDGLTLARRLHQLHPQTKIIMLTAHDHMRSFAHPADSPLHTVMVKPVSPPSLRSFVSDLLTT